MLKFEIWNRNIPSYLEFFVTDRIPNGLQWKLVIKHILEGGLCPLCN